MSTSNSSATVLPFSHYPTPSVFGDGQNSLPNTRPTSRQNTAERSAKDCFFKVIDISMDDSELTVRGETYSRRNVDDCIANLQPQPLNSVRIFLDGRGESLPPFSQFAESVFLCCNSSELVLDLPKCKYYPRTRPWKPLRPYYFPAFNVLEDHSSEPMAYEMGAYYKHGIWCHRNVDRKIEHLHTPVRLVPFWKQGKAAMICWGPGAEIDSESPFLGPCANTSWIWLTKVDAILRELSHQRGASNDQDTFMKLLSLEILFERFNAFDLHLQEIKYECSYLRISEFRIVGQASLMMIPFLLEAIHRLENIFEAIKYVSSCLHTPPSIGPQEHHWHSIEKKVKAAELDFVYWSRHIEQLKIEHDDRQAVKSRISNTKQSAGVTQLTTLATFFLPISLAAGILSMQTRFSDLGPLLYDFVGVVTLLSVIAILLLLVTRYGKTLVERVIEMFYPTVAEHQRISRWFRYAGLGLWCLAFVVSFSVGMIVKIKLGWEVLGFAAAGITALGFIMMIILHTVPPQFWTIINHLPRQII